MTNCACEQLLKEILRKSYHKTHIVSATVYQCICVVPESYCRSDLAMETITSESFEMLYYGPEESKRVRFAAGEWSVGTQTLSCITFNESYFITFSIEYISCTPVVLVSFMYCILYL